MRLIWKSGRKNQTGKTLNDEVYLLPELRHLLHKCLHLEHIVDEGTYQLLCQDLHATHSLNEVECVGVCFRVLVKSLSCKELNRHLPKDLEEQTVVQFGGI